jgi:hypothetical protein
MSSVGSNNVAFWAARDPGASSGAVVAEILVVLRRTRFRDMTGVDMRTDDARRRILGLRYTDGVEKVKGRGAHKDMYGWRRSPGPD